ncbi:unnamed protein product, partial [Porites lobata]
FLKHLGILYDTFGITCKAATSQPITPEQVIQNLNTVDGYIKATVMNVKETNNLKENSTTSGPQGTRIYTFSHFKHETFDVLQYATDFGTISKESLKRITKGGGEILHASIFILPSATDWDGVQGHTVHDTTSS